MAQTPEALTLPIVTQPLTLTYWAPMSTNVAASMKNFGEMGCYTELEKRTEELRKTLAVQTVDEQDLDSRKARPGGGADTVVHVELGPQHRQRHPRAYRFGLFRTFVGSQASAISDLGLAGRTRLRQLPVR